MQAIQTIVLYLKKKVDEKFNLKNTNMYPIGSVIGTHTGPGAYGFANLKRDSLFLIITLTLDGDANGSP